MKKLYSFENAINFLRKGIALSLLILLSVTTHSNSIDKNTARKTGGDFLLEKPAVPLPNSKREDVYSYAENPAMTSKTETLILAGRSDDEAPLPPPPEAADSYEPNNTPETASVLTATFNTNHTSIINILNANCHINTDIDIYKIDLEAGYLYTLNGVLYDTDNNVDNNNHYTLDVKSEYSTNGTTWVEWGDRQLPTRTVPGGTIYLKILPYASSGNTGTYAAKIEVKKAAKTGCTYTLPAAPTTGLTANAGTHSVAVTVTAGESCFWTATSNANWIKLTSGQSGTGSGSVGFDYKPNMATGLRTGTITIATQTYSITQQGRPLSADSYEENNTPTAARVLTPSFTENVSTDSISANCHSNTDIDIYKINLETTHSYLLSGVLYDSDNNRISNHNFTLNAKISYSTNGSLWSSWPGNQWSGVRVPGGSIYLKIEPALSGQMGTYAARIEVKKASTTGCTYTALPESKEATPGGGTNQQVAVTVTAGQSCLWTATSNASWIRITSGQSGTGSGSVVYSHDANTTASPRTGTISIADKTHTVTQGIQPDTYEGADGNNTPANARLLTADFVNNESTVTISAANCHNTTDVDYYKINLAAGFSYILSATLSDLINPYGSGYTLDAKISYSTDGSTWSRTEDEQISASTIPGGILYFKIEPYYSDAPRRVGTYAARIDLKKAGTTGCSYVFSPVSGVLTSAETSQQVTVTTASSCFWSASSNVNWITLISGQYTTGPGTLVYSYTANTEWVSRTGTITIAGRTYTVTQSPSSLTPDAFEGANGNNTLAEAHLLTPVLTANAATLSISAANCHNTSDVDFYKINLEADYHYTVSATLHDKFNQTGNSYTLDAKISYSTDGSIWSYTEDSQLSNTIVEGGGTLYFKIEPYHERRVGTYAATINLSRIAGCTYVFSPASQVVTSQAGTAQITVTASASCTSSRTVTVASGGSWITLTSGHSATTGSGVVVYSYTKNESLTFRVGTITSAGQTYTVTQLPPPLPRDSYEGDNGNNTLAQAYAFTPVFAQNASTVSISAANCHNITDIDFYKINLEAGYLYTVSGELFERYNNRNNYTLDVKISYSTDGSTWSRTEDSQLPNMTVQGGALYFKIEPFNPGNTGTYAAKIDLKIERSAACIYGLPVASVEVTADEGLNQQAELRVTEGQSCPWTATSNNYWITVTSGQSGTGAGNVGYTYRANGATASRTGTITIAGYTYTIIQAARPLTADSYEVNNTVAQASELTANFTQNASNLSIFATCHNNSDIDFYKINLEAGYLYTVSGVLYDTENNTANNNNYTIDVRSYYSTNAATPVSDWEEWGDRELKNLTVQGTLYFKIQPYYAGRTGSYGAKIEIKKVGTPGCTYALPITGRAVTWEAGTAQQAEVTTSSTGGLSCFRAATSNVPWITLTSGQSGTGNGQVVYSYEANTTQSSRTGTISIADKTYTVTQGIQPDGYEENNTPAQAWSFTPEFTENVSTVTISEANCHNATDVDYYKIILDDRYSYTVSGMLYDSDHQDLYHHINNSLYTVDVKISYSGDGSSWSREFDRQLPGMTAPGGILYLKIVPYSTGGMGSYAARIEIKKAAKAGCTYTLPAWSKEVASAAGTHQENVTTGESCLWTATSNTEWITLTSGQSTTGSGTVAYSYSDNTAWALRTGTITIAGRTYTVTQLPPPLTPDSYEVNNTPDQAWLLTATFAQNKSTLSISEANCHNVADVDFYKINLEAGYRYTIGGVLRDAGNQSNGSSYTLDVRSYYSTDGSNWHYWGDRQLTTLTVQGSEILYLKITPYQEGRTGTYAARIEIDREARCIYSFAPKSKEATSVAGSGQVTVTASTLCNSSWTPTTNAAWITIPTGQSGTGSRVVDYSYEANTGWSSREGTITIDGQPYKVTQLPPSLQKDSYEGENGNNTLQQAYSFTPVFTQNASTLSISPANCHHVNDVDFYKINLESGYFYTVGLVLRDEHNDSNNYTLDAYVYYSTDGSAWSYRSDNGFSLGAVQGGNLYIKIEPWIQGQVGTYSATINISITGGCSTSLLAASGQAGSPQGTGKVDVATGLLCSWTATSNVPWITLTSAQNGTTGPGSVDYSYQENIVMETRTGTITVAGKTYTLTQAAAPACTFTISSNTADVTEAAGTGSVSVNPLRSNCVWTATSNVEWITLTSGQSGTGNGSVGYSYRENIVTEARTGTITVAGQTYTVNQAAAPVCTFTISPSPENVTKAAGTGSVTVTALRSNCAWTATSNVPWITLTSGQSGTGNGSVGYSYTENKTATPRTGTITVANQTYTVNQAATPCTFTLASSTANATAAAGSGSLSVTALPGDCAWTATSSVEWITLTSGQSGTTGSGSVGYSYTENKTAASRTGTITAANQTFTLTQSLVTGIEPAGHVKIFPNPAGDFVTVDLSAGHVKYVSLKIVSQFGQTLYERNNPNQTLQISLKGFANGLYFIQIQGEEKVWVEKLVIKH